MRALLETLRRWWCGRVGHDPVLYDAEPMGTFPLCRRCGRWGRP